jgi:GDPmannose 4,6-dehydratase
LFYASSILIFGYPQDEIQKELSKFKPENPYSISKVAGMMACRFYREHKGIFASCGILYNHESPLRSPRFVTRKIVQAAVKIFREGGGELTLGNLDIYVDWGYAPDYVNAMKLILALSEPNDFIVATGKAYSIREFADLSFKYVGLNYRNFVKFESDLLTRSNSRRIGNPSFLKEKTGWRPSLSFENMISLMMEDELKKYPSF